MFKQKLFGIFRWLDFNYFQTARIIRMRFRYQRLPGVGHEQGQPEGLIFGTICWNKSCLEYLDGLISTFSGQLGPSGSSPGAVPVPKTARSRTRARTTQGIDFWAKLYYQKLLGMKNWVGLRFFRTSRTIWVKSRGQGQFQRQRQPEVVQEQGQHKGLISGQSCITKSCWK